ncbi:hypothetical protein F2Q69_00001079, partial [Brassica cretica]
DSTIIEGDGADRVYQSTVNRFGDTIRRSSDLVRNLDNELTFFVDSCGLHSFGKPEEHGSCGNVELLSAAASVVAMGSSPAPFPDIGRKAKDLLNKDYIFDQKFTLTMLSATGTKFVATGLQKDDLFFGDISTLYKGQNTIVDLKIDSNSSVSTKVTVKNLMPSAKAVISFKIPDHKSGKVSAS